MNYTNVLLKQFTFVPMSSNEGAERLLGAFTQAITTTKKNGHKAVYKFEDNLKAELERQESFPCWNGFYIRFYRRDRFRDGYTYSIEARSRMSSVYYSAYVDSETNTLESLAEGLNDSWQRLERWKKEDQDRADERSDEFQSEVNHTVMRIMRELEGKFERQGTKEQCELLLRETLKALESVTSYVKQTTETLKTI